MTPLLPVSDLFFTCKNLVVRHWRVVLWPYVIAMLVGLPFNAITNIPEGTLMELLETQTALLIAVLGFTFLAYLAVSIWSGFLIAKRWILVAEEKAEVAKTTQLTWQDVGSISLIALLTMLVTVPAFLLFILPGIWLSTRLSYGMYAYFTEGLRGRAALKHSFELTRGRFWAIFGRSIAVSLLVYFGMMAVLFGILALLVIAAFIIGFMGAMLGAVGVPPIGLAILAGIIGIPLLLAFFAAILVITYLGMLMYTSLPAVLFLDLRKKQS